MNYTSGFAAAVPSIKALCDEGMKNFMNDPRVASSVNPMLFDGKRVIYGGFQMISHA